MSDNHAKAVGWPTTEVYILNIYVSPAVCQRVTGNSIRGDPVTPDASSDPAGDAFGLPRADGDDMHSSRAETYRSTRSISIAGYVSPLSPDEIVHRSPENYVQSLRACQYNVDYLPRDKGPPSPPSQVLISSCMFVPNSTKCYINTRDRRTASTRTSIRQLVLLRTLVRVFDAFVCRGRYRPISSFLGIRRSVGQYGFDQGETVRYHCGDLHISTQFLYLYRSLISQ